MKSRSILILILALAVLTLLNPPQVYSQEKTTSWEVYFSPPAGCTTAITNELDKAKRTILIQASEFNSSVIAKAIIQAHTRGVTVQVIFDKSHRTKKHSSATFLSNEGITLKIDSKHNIAHNKVMIVDAETVITGSFNFTNSAELRNAENLLIIHDTSLAARYLKNWELHAAHSEIYKARH